MKIAIPVCLALVAFFGTVGGTISDGQVRLNNQGDMNTNGGILEVYYQGEWGKVCPSGYWNSNAATVVCRQLGFAATGYVFNPSDFVDPDSDPNQKVWMDNVSCTGDEQTIVGCFSGEMVMTTSSCSGDVAAVLCGVEKKEVGDNDDLFKLKVRAVELLLDLLRGTKK
ncbi:scavenger receptor cysteine-rich type 1 protein M160 [Strongylocentrotus purpuratus]|uniref:SRCR domain-containing protein n=1 Tax=Strongylocentrotus purpuratus TaxID=7668 RepID=A0A7M7N006_STRPU|nr:scavenger receptor cysteine-rich type 1 protein M160 [Strongylocentrotus purpuratus]